MRWRPARPGRRPRRPPPRARSWPRCGKLFAVAENYPDLKANQNFLALQAELSNTEDRLQTARRFYNANVRDFNRGCSRSPRPMIAGMFHFQPEEFFEVRTSPRGGPRPRSTSRTPAGGRPRRRPRRPRRPLRRPPVSEAPPAAAAAPAG